jgi:hypothetical protein
MKSDSKASGVAAIFRHYGETYRQQHHLPLQQHKVMNAITACRTSALGGYVDQCDQCGHERISYCSCRNRHCPGCQAGARAKWLMARKQQLLPIGYFHIVFTVPAGLNPVALINQKVVYGILFRAAAETLRELGRDDTHLGAELGIIAMLHTWGQNLLDHPHLHCIVTGGGLSKDGARWIKPKRTSKGKDFFVHVNIISDLFKKKFLAYLQEAYAAGDIKCVGRISHLASPREFRQFKNALYKQKWVTYCKEPFGNVERAINYLGGYSHRVAISNNRIVTVADGKVTFRWKDYRDNTQKLMTLDAHEFIRRFLLHVLPHRFYKIRYYGILSTRNVSKKLALCKKLLAVIEQTEPLHIDWVALFFELTGIDLGRCPVCHQGRMVPKGKIDPVVHSPPLRKTCYAQ